MSKIVFTFLFLVLCNSCTRKGVDSYAEWFIEQKPVVFKFKNQQVSVKEIPREWAFLQNTKEKITKGFLDTLYNSEPSHLQFEVSCKSFKKKEAKKTES